MSEIMKASAKRPSLLSFILSAPRSWFWLLSVDVYPALTAAALPWSTTGVAIFMVIWFIVLLPTLDREFLRSLRRPASALPLALLALALVGMLWAEGPLSVRLLGLTPAAKLFAIPFLIYHFQRSQRGHWVFIAFFASCALLMGLSWVSYFADWKVYTANPGVPVKNYINQSHEFALCLLAAAPLLLKLISESRRELAVGCAVLMLGFYCSMIYVATARVVLLYLPVLLIIFAFRYFTRTSAIWLLTATIAVSALLSFTSPYARQRVEFTARDYKLDRDNAVAVADASNDPSVLPNGPIATSNGVRLGYWRASIESIAKAPLFGHGTGSTKQLFDREAKGKSGEWANAIRNPHNQTLYVAIQWGMLGCVVLFGMWYSHLLLFRGLYLPAWIGFVVVVQNVVSSLLNSHLFDFHEGWIYVLGVGVAGGMVSRARDIQTYGSPSVDAIKV